jgi:hypothetical protein
MDNDTNKEPELSDERYLIRDDDRFMRELIEHPERTPGFNPNVQQILINDGNGQKHWENVEVKQ